MRIRNIEFVLFLCTLVASASFAQQKSWPLPPNASTPLSAGNNTSYGRLPPVFEANQGQAAPQVKFLFRGRGYTAFLTSGSMVLTLRSTNAASIPESFNPHSANSVPLVSTTTMQFRLTGAATSPMVVGEDHKTGKVNYFIGNDPTKWRTNVPTYARVRYKNVYPGIDLVYYGSGRKLECDFAVSPGADPNQIQFEITGADGIRIDESGGLVLHTMNGDLHFESPVVYQEANGQRFPVDGGYVMNDPTHVGFRIAHFDSNNALVIDPVLTYSTYLGGSGIDQPSGVVVDSSGAVYVAGYTDSANFPLATLGSLPNDTYHVFVAKLDPTGSNLVYADYIGGNSQDYGIALVLDSVNDVYVTGSTESSDFPIVTPYQAEQPGPYAGFLTKVAADGSSLLYSTYLGGNTFDQPTGIAIDSLGQVHVAGYTMSQNFPVANAYQATALANQDGIYGSYGFLTKFSPDGSSLIYSTYLAGNSNVVQDCGTPCWPAPYNTISAVALDTSGNAYVTGTTNTYNFPVTPGTYQTSNSTQQDASVGFVSKFTSVGNLAYSTYFYGSSGDPVEIAAIAVDSSGSAYVAGSAESDGTFPITSTSICDPGVFGFGCSYAFVTKFDSTGSTLLYSTFLGPNNYASPQAIALDVTGDAYILAATRSGLFQTNNAIEPYTNNTDVLLVEIDPAATTQLFSTFLGGSGDDSPSGLALDTSGNLYVVGSTNSVDFPTTQGAFQPLPGGSIDAFVSKIGSSSASSVSLSPPSLQYSLLSIGSTSQSQTVLLRNMGSSPLSIASITINGDFAETDNCGSSVPAAASCTFSVTFTPTAAGIRNGSVSLQDNAAGSPHVITLIGSGAGANVALSPASLSFSTQPVGTSSAAQTVTLTNTGNATLNISGIQTTGDFSQISNCPSTLASNLSCTLNISFTPTVTGTRNGMLTLNDNAQASPQTVTLTGTGSASLLIATTTPTTLVFLSQQVGTSSAAQTVTLTNTGNATLNISSIQITGDFAQVNNCSSTLASNVSCTLNVSFTPTTTGTRSGTLTLSDNAQGSPQSVPLTGTGSASLPIATMTPTNLVFLSQQVGTSSATQTVTLTNTGNATLNVASIQITGDFSQINNCSSTLASNVSCTLNVSFTPTTAGTRNGALTLSDNAQASPQSVTLTGAGSASLPIATVTPTNLVFLSQQVGTSSAAQTVTLTNTGNATLNISNIQITGDFTQINNCPSTLASSLSCTLNISFTPTTAGTRNGTLTLSDNAQGSPQSVPLTGTGSASLPVATVTPTSLVFLSQQVGTSSTAQTVTLTNTGNATLNISSIQIAGDFSQINNCPATLASSLSCTLNISFTPTVAGTRNGTLTLSDNAQGSPPVVNLTGLGMDFSLTGSPSSNALNPGKSVTYQLVVSPLGGTFSNIVKLSCAGAPLLAACSISPSTVTPNGSAATASLTITTTASVTQLVPIRPSPDSTFYAIWVPLQGFGLIGMILAGSGVKSRKARRSFFLTLIGAALMFMGGCAGGTGITTPPQNGTAPGTYTITVTGTSGALQHSLPVTLIVQ